MQAKYFRFSTLAAAISCLGSAALATPAEVTINVMVEEIAILSVTDDNATVILSSSDRAGFQLPVDPDQTAALQLQTNFCVGLEVDYPRVTGLRGGFSTQWYGEAIGINTGATLGVAPYITHPGGVSAVNPLQNILSGTPASAVGGSTNDNGISVSGGTGNLCTPANGTFDFRLGVITKWDLTLPPEPLFAAPDTYRIPLTVSIVP